MNDPTVAKAEGLVCRKSEELLKVVATEKAPVDDETEFQLTRATISTAVMELRIQPGDFDFDNQIIVAVFSGLRGEVGARVTIDKVTREEETG